MKHKVVIVDDHTLFTKALEEMVNQFSGYEILFSAENGKDFIDKLSVSKMDPDIVLLDLNMPIMDGYQTLKWIKEHKKNLKTLVLSMNDNERNIIKAITKGANGYLIKSITPKELNLAFTHLIEHGFYHNDLVSRALLKRVSEEKDIYYTLKEREIIFLKLACTEKTYKEIANEMCLSPKTIDGYRQALFEKLNIKSRVGLVLYAIQNNLID